MTTFNTLLRKASSILKIGAFDSNQPKVNQEGEVAFCKNNVCVHPPTPLRTDMMHHPGYLTIKEQNDEILGSTLILTWIPNTTLKKNPRSLENRTPESSPCRSTYSSSCPSPSPSSRSPFHLPLSSCNSPYPGSEKSVEEFSQFASKSHHSDRRSISSTISDIGSPREDLGSLDSFPLSDQTELTPSTSSQILSNDVNDLEMDDGHNDPGVDLTHDKSKETSVNDGGLQSQSDSGIGPEEVIAALNKMICGLNDMDHSNTDANSDEVLKTDSDIKEETCNVENKIISSENTAQSQKDVTNIKSDLALDISGNLNEGMQPPNPLLQTPGINISSYSPTGSRSSSTTPTTSNKDPESFPSTPGETPPMSPTNRVSKLLFVEGTPESLAHAHNLSFPDSDLHNKVSKRESSCGIFTVDLRQMRSLRLFYSNKECTCGQLVIASRESQYKILHFHCGGLDKLAKVFEEYNFLSKAKTKTSDNCPYRQFSVCRPVLTDAECHPEDSPTGVYSMVDEQTWRNYMADDGSIEDELQLRKEIFFRGLDVKLRKEVWPFLLHYYRFHSTFDEREQMRNDKYIEYQAIRRKRDQMTAAEKDVFWRNIQCTVEKDVIRTDRSHPFFVGEDNPNIEIMKNILLNYGFYNPKIGYTQGMSDLLSPILAAVQDESEAFWCFVGLMQGTIFVTCPKDFDVDVNLNYLRELLRVMNKKFYEHLCWADALDLLFVHRWILLCFKREFCEAEAMKMWEACWAHYQTDYFHLFICSAIVAIYGDDVIAQAMKADEMLVHFSSLAMYMNGDLVIRKARGLLHQFRLLPRIPCTLSRLCELCGPGMWDSGHVPLIDCVGDHGDHSCPYGGQDPTMKLI